MFALFGALLLLGGIVALSEGTPDSESRAIYGIVIGAVMLGFGITWYKRGRKPGIEAAAIRAAQAVAATQPAEATKRCPHCAEVILAAARKCKHCGSEIAS